MSVSRKENGSLVKKAGRVLVDLALNRNSNKSIANSVVSYSLLDGIGGTNDVFRFGTDGQGNYGYIKKVDGADTFCPFKEEVPQQIKFLRDGITTYVSKTNGSLTSVSTSDNLLKIKNGTGLSTDEYFAFSQNLYNLVKQVFGADVASVKFTMEHLTSKGSGGFGLKSGTSSTSIGYPFFNVKQTDSDLSVTIDVETTLKNYKYLGTGNGDTLYWYIGNITIEKVI